MTYIDTEFDFTSDTPGFWDGFWERRKGLGYCGNDPDTDSPTMRRYHRQLWSRELPNGQMMELKEGISPYDYLSSNGMRLASDSIMTTFRLERSRPLIGSVADSVDDYQGWMEAIIRKTYRIGGAVLFPKHRSSINQCRGNSMLIRDRWDLTLECIRRFYSGEWSPLEECLEKDREFFELFVDFKGYVDFFLLQDCVSDDYKTVNMWIDRVPFENNPFPKDVNEYKRWIVTGLDFIDRRNERIRILADGL